VPEIALPYNDATWNRLFRAIQPLVFATVYIARIIIIDISIIDPGIRAAKHSGGKTEGDEQHT
jgi:hypothetical protein